MEDRKLFAGIDTHKDTHALCVIDERAAIVFEGGFATDDEGLEALGDVLGDLGSVECVAIEGTNSYGYGIARHLEGLGYPVKEALRPGPRPCGPAGKTDAGDAYSAAYAAFLGKCPEGTKAMGGPAQRLSFLVEARDCAVKQTTAITNTVKGLLVRSPRAIRQRYGNLGGRDLMEALCRVRAPKGDDFEIIVSLKSLARRWRLADEQARELADAMASILNAGYADLLSLPGVGVQTAAVLVAHIGDNPTRFATDAQLARSFGTAPIPVSSGKTDRHRLNRGGDRRANCAVHAIAIARMGCDGKTRAYIAGKMAQGKTKREAIRCLKRYIVREIFNILCNPRRKPDATSLPPLRECRKELKVTLPTVAEALGTTTSFLSLLERSKIRDLAFERRYWQWLQDLKALENVSQII